MVYRKKNYIIAQNEMIIKDVEVLGSVVDNYSRMFSEQIERCTSENTERIVNLVNEKVNNALAGLAERTAALEARLSSMERNLEDVKYFSNHGLLETEALMRKFANYNPELALLSESEKTKILICGFYGGNNLGDELMLETLLGYLTRDLDASFTVMLANNGEYDIFDKDGIHYIHYPQTKYDYDHLASFYDVVIFGGGALLNDDDYGVVYGNEVSLSTTVVELSRKMIEYGKRCLWLGLSSNHEIENKAFIERLNYVIPRLTYVSFRDTNSIDSLKRAGVDVSCISLQHDLIIANSILADPPEKSCDTLSVGMIFICGIRDLEEKQLMIIKAVEERLRASGREYRINLIPFYDYMKADVTALERLAESAGSENVAVMPYVNRFSEIADIISGQDYIISMRYHGALLSLMMNKPLFSIVLDTHPHYRNKMSYLCEKYDRTGNSADISGLNEEKLARALDVLFGEKHDNDNARFVSEARENIENVIEKYLK
ncbi:MAG: polysaccharide pyruvyl transferase family protein [Clostridia bacterium]|nr:polysaccharide pyruvyl transferase family protein [Clostridia bacterium]